MSRLLLISSSRTQGTGFLDHCEAAIRQRLGGVNRVLFVPYALFDRDGYAQLARLRFAQMGCVLESIHASSQPAQTLNQAEAVFVGGGNSFRLLRELYRHDLVPALRQRVDHGMIYIGSSAGTNMACPTIRTTNDMPIVETPSLDALQLVPFQINPHYLDADPLSTHQGETREQRLAEYLEENSTPVVGLREGSWLMADDREYFVGGARGARLFQPARPPLEVVSGSHLSWNDDRLMVVDPA